MPARPRKPECGKSGHEGALHDVVGVTDLQRKFAEPCGSWTRRRVFSLVTRPL